MKFFKIQITDVVTDVFYYETEAKTAEDAHARAKYFADNRRVFQPMKKQGNKRVVTILVTECLEKELEGRG